MHGTRTYQVCLCVEKCYLNKRTNRDCYDRKTQRKNRKEAENKKKVEKGKKDRW